MIIAKVVGSAVATVKHETLGATKLLLVRQADVSGAASGDPLVAVDLVGAGPGELVLVSQGSSARKAVRQEAAPVDAAIVGILDSLQVEGTITFRKE
jgi:ethanolamine utilization protein EutN